MNNKLKIDESGTITNDGQIMSKQDLELNFIDKTSFDAKLVLTVFANLYVEQFAKDNIEDYYKPAHWPGMHYKLFRMAYNTLVNQMIVLVNMQGMRGEIDGKTDLLKAAGEYPKS